MVVVETSEQAAQAGAVLQARWLGSDVPYQEAWDLQEALFKGTANHLLLLEHEPVFTLGRCANPENILLDTDALGANVVHTNRGGDVTFHGPGQLVGYPVMNVKGKRGGGLVDTAQYVFSVEQVILDTLAEFGLQGERIVGCPGVWLDATSDNPRKIAAVGVRLSRGRSMHGFALNVAPDMSWFEKIVPCGIEDKAVTSMRQEGSDATVEQVVASLVAHGAARFGFAATDRSDVVWKIKTTDLSLFSQGKGPGEKIVPKTNAEAAAMHVVGKSDDANNVGVADERSSQVRDGVSVRLQSRLKQAGVTEGLEISSRKPDWMKVKFKTDKKFLELKKKTKDLSLTTVCEEAGCPNIYDCWNEGTATFMLLGERCTRACGFCLVDTRKPLAPDLAEPQRVATAVADMGIKFAVLTMVARDDLDDGGAAIVAQTVEAIHATSPGVGVEVLISDLQGDATDLKTVCDAKPEIVNHNIETVARLQRAVRPSARYSRSLTLLARAKSYGMQTKSGLIVGMGETKDEVVSTLVDLAAVGVDIVTIGQYLRPTSHHLPIARWWTPEEFEELKQIGETELGIGHVASSPLTRSSHHAGSIASTLAV